MRLEPNITSEEKKIGIKFLLFHSKAKTMKGCIGGKAGFHGTVHEDTGISFRDLLGGNILSNSVSTQESSS